MDENKCKSCMYFRQHYTLCGNRLTQVYCGHCTFKTPKTKHPDHQACEHFEQGEADTARFVSKEYLSRKLLEHVLNMELLPPIGEMPNLYSGRG